MAGLGIGLLQALTDKMRWSEARQQLLSQNVANADTPGYRSRDLEAFSTRGAGDPSAVTLAAMTTDPDHIAVASHNGAAFGTQLMNGFEVTPEGNGVTLEDEMMKVTDNQMQYAAAATLYTRTLQLLRTALKAPGV